MGTNITAVSLITGRLRRGIDIVFFAPGANGTNRGGIVRVVYGRLRPFDKQLANGGPVRWAAIVPRVCDCSRVDLSAPVQAAKAGSANDDLEPSPPKFDCPAERPGVTGTARIPYLFRRSDSRDAIRGRCKSAVPARRSEGGRGTSKNGRLPCGPSK
jgi:hypothetical protein